MKRFATSHLLHWIEVCSLFGELRGAILSLAAAGEALITANCSIGGVIDLLQDCERFTMEFFPCLSVSSLQVYSSALLFTPCGTSLRRTYENEMLLPLKVLNAPEERWSPCVLVMEGHDDEVHSVAYSPDGGRVISGSDDNTIRLWDAITGALLLSFVGHRDLVKSVAFSLDGARIVSGSRDTTIRLWDATNGKHLHTLKGHSKSVESVAFSPDGTRIGSTSLDGTIRLWDAMNGAHIRSSHRHTGSIESLAFSPNGTRMVSSSGSFLQLWDAETLTHMHTLNGHLDQIFSVSFSRDGTRIGSGSLDRTVCFWNAETGVLLHTIQIYSGRIETIALLPDGARIVTSSDDGCLRIWDAISGEFLSRFEGHSKTPTVTSAAFSPDCTRFVSGSWDGTLRIWDVSRGYQAQSPTNDSDDGGGFDTDSITLSPDSIAFSADNQHLVTVSQSNVLHLWNANTGACFLVLEGHRHSIRAVVFCPAGLRIASGSADRTIKLWNIRAGTHLTLDGHLDVVQSVAFSPDGAHIASGSSDTTVRLWDANSGSHLHVFLCHSEVTSVVFFPDGTRVLSGCLDGTLQLRDTTNGTLLRTIEHVGVFGAVQSIAFSPSGTHIVSGHRRYYSPFISLWDARTGAHLDQMSANPWSARTIARSLDTTQTSMSGSEGENTLISARTLPVRYFDVENGWIVNVLDGKRFCWIPVSYRTGCLAASDTQVAICMRSGTTVILTFG